MKILATLGGQNKVRGETVLTLMTTADTKLDIGHQYYVTIQDINDKRTLNQNSLYWALVNKVAKAVNLSSTEVHNRVLVDCRIPWLDAEGEYIWICLKDDDTWLRRTDFHVAPTSRLEDKNGTLYRWFMMLLPSHLMDKQEMGRLLDRIIDAAEEMGIHTEPELIQKAKENTSE